MSNNIEKFLCDHGYAQIAGCTYFIMKPPQEWTHLLKQAGYTIDTFYNFHWQEPITTEYNYGMYNNEEARLHDLYTQLDGQFVTCIYKKQ